jgi:decaprenylphospho-beta-D-ribofuranose 2-oxidase
VGRHRDREPTLSGWGRLSVPGREVRSEDLERITAGAVLTRGLGRSYGDSSLPPPSPSPGDREVAATPLADRILAFDEETGRLRGEAGLSLLELNRLLLPRGWFVPVSPGTQYVTLGGMVAADVHGKNHHVDGTLGRHVEWLRIRLAGRSGGSESDEAGQIVTCSRDERPDLFRATLGGMGLTGHILEVELRMRRIPSPWILQESERHGRLADFLGALKTASREWPYTVGWIDGLSRGRKTGRGILNRGRWAEPGEAPERPPSSRRRLSVPFVLPGFVLSRPPVRAFNTLYFHAHPRRMRRRIVHPESFFYPLDAVLHWNRMYGRRGLTQYQCVLPEPGSTERARRFLERLTELEKLGGASFLCVVKDCGEEGEGLLSFPRPGVSIALDLPVRETTTELVARLDELVIREGGRIYLAKDAFTTEDHFRAMEPRLPEFERVRAKYDPEGRIRSAQSVRVLGDPPTRKVRDKRDRIEPG